MMTEILKKPEHFCQFARNKIQWIDNFLNRDVYGARYMDRLHDLMNSPPFNYTTIYTYSRYRSSPNNVPWYKSNWLVSISIERFHTYNHLISMYSYIFKLIVNKTLWGSQMVFLSPQSSVITEAISKTFGFFKRIIVLFHLVLTFARGSARLIIIAKHAKPRTSSL